MCGRRDESLLVDDMIRAAERVIELAPLVPPNGEPKQEVAEMILWNVAVLGEAAKRIPVAVRTEYPEINWRAMARTRDVVVHHYEGVDWEVVRHVAMTDLPQLLPQLVEIRNALRE